jgi:arylsulfatase A-like enzyme
MRWSGTIPAGTVCNELATTMDLLPTFASLAGGKVPGDRIIDGHDIRSLMVGKKGAKSPYKVFYYYEADQLQAVRSGPWKLFVPLKEFNQHPHFKKGMGMQPLLFNVVKDTSSRYNVADKYPQIVNKLMALAEKGRQDLGDRGRAGANQRPLGKIENPIPVSGSSYPYIWFEFITELFSVSSLILQSLNKGLKLFLLCLLKRGI